MLYRRYQCTTQDIKTTQQETTLKYTTLNNMPLHRSRKHNNKQHYSLQCKTLLNKCRKFVFHVRATSNIWRKLYIYAKHAQHLSLHKSLFSFMTSYHLYPCTTTFPFTTICISAFPCTTSYNSAQHCIKLHNNRF